MGGNDYFSRATSAANATFIEQQKYVDYVISEFSKVIKNINKIGARKFVFQSVEALDCIPMMRTSTFNYSDGCAATPLTLATLHNAALYKMAQSIQNSPEYSEFLYAIFDTLPKKPESEPPKTTVGDALCFDINVELKTPPNGYNCTDSSGVNPDFDGELCDDPLEYVFFDNEHNTNEMNRQMSELIWSGGRGIVYPYNMEHLVRLDPAVAKNGCSGEDKSLCLA